MLVLVSINFISVNAHTFCYSDKKIVINFFFVTAETLTQILDTDVFIAHPKFSTETDEVATNFGYECLDSPPTTSLHDDNRVRFKHSLISFYIFHFIPQIFFSFSAISRSAIYQVVPSKKTTKT